MTIRVKKDGTFLGANAVSDVLVALAAQVAKTKAEAVAALTDNSAGSAASGAISYVGAFTATAASGSNLADKTTTEAALVKVKDGIAELTATANLYAAKLGHSALTDSSGGASADGTMGAMDNAVTGATTGSLAANMSAIAVSMNANFYNLAQRINKMAVNCGLAPVTIDSTFKANGLVKSDTIVAISTSTGTAASPAATKAAVDAALVIWRNNAAVLAAKLNALRAASAALVTAG